MFKKKINHKVISKLRYFSSTMKLINSCLVDHNYLIYQL